ncbi:MAG: cytochrome b/b6 domain-containing protein [Verrucomicrobia bacterium]|nr:cytochrome b/b6 domain-containing protein [Verrucomicrobiota bacterium]
MEMRDSRRLRGGLRQRTGRAWRVAWAVAGLLGLVQIRAAEPVTKPPLVPDRECVDCHDDQPERVTRLSASVHKDVACADCHEYSAGNLDAHQKAIPFGKRASCGNCHREPYTSHRDSIHGISLDAGVREAAQCWDCHGSHGIVKVDSTNSPVRPENLPGTCGRCHDNPEFVAKFSMGFKTLAAHYSKSVHGLLLANKASEGKTASCVKCHGVHDIKNRVQPGSTISSFSVPATCGQCHQEVRKEYEKSIHWVLARRGVHQAPVCNDCHSEHDVSRVNTVTPKAEMRRLQDQSCLRCHADPVLAGRFGLDASKVNQYLDSYHGLAAARGDSRAALCVDCHGKHSILPKEHPDSLIHPANVQKTCQTCHPTATGVFAQSYTHNPIVAKSATVEAWVQRIYLWLIVFVIGGMLFHNLLVMVHELRKHKAARKSEVVLSRFNRSEVVQHFLLMIVFVVLAFTGFALKFPDFILYRAVENLGLNEPLRQWIHRIAGAGLILLGAYHLFYLAARRSGRALLAGLLPGWRDLREFGNSVLYYLRLRKSHPEFGLFNYVEKSEYWALVWGTVIMGVTGFILWFPMVVGEWAPVWLIRASELVHYYEAILATLAILVWHLFFVIYHPGEYPMNLSWIDGKITLSTFKTHYRQQYKEILADWNRLRLGRVKETDLSYRTREFLSFLRNSGLDPDKVIQEDLAQDGELRAWLAGQE